MPCSHTRWLFLAGLLAGLSLLATGCGGGSKSPAVASLSTTTSTGTASNATKASFAFALPPGGAGIGTSISATVGTSAGVKFTACMRSNGVPGFPDPDSKGTITITVSTSLNPSSPLFQKAEAGCQHLLPAGKGLSKAQQQKMQARVLAFAACMRSNGVPGYPDPTFSNGGVSQGYGSKDGIDPKSPVFKSAQKACQAKQAD
ncbi:MAG TPA: hypothetical protein VG652_09845 [Gaiellaceae bacterium]|nr:hypothetical protein [Gaiellaceae bacterium]